MRSQPQIGLADLHRHHDTSHTPESIQRVSTLLGIKRFQDLSVDEIRRQVQAPQGVTFKEWLKYLDVVREAYVSPQAVAELTRDVMKDAASEGLNLLELRISLLSTVAKIQKWGSTVEPFWTIARETFDGILQVRDEVHRTTSVVIDLILSISCRTQHLQYVDEYVVMMKDYASKIVGIDLTNEEENPPTTYRDAIERIRSDVPFLTIHCMETTGPERGWQALELKPQRLGHGINAVRDPRLVEEIGKRGIVLEICPLSNLLTGVTTKSTHPFKLLDAAGLKLTICHDGLNDSRTLKDDYDSVRTTFQYSGKDMDRFKRNAWESAFRNMHLAEGRSSIHRKVDERTLRDIPAT